MSDKTMSSVTSLSNDVHCNLEREDQAIPKSKPALPSSEHLPNVSATLPLLHGKMTLAEALDQEDNVLFPLAYSSQREDFLFWIYEYRED